MDSANCLEDTLLIISDNGYSKYQPVIMQLMWMCV